MRMSIRTTSGRCRSTAPSTSRPSAASATTSRFAAPASIIRRPERTSASSSTSRTRIIAAGVARRTNAPSGSTPCSSVAAGERDALGEPDQAGPRPGQRRGRGDGHRREAADLDLQVAVGRADGERHRCSRRVLARVRQALLHDPVGGAPDGGGRRRVAQLDPGGDPHPGRARLLDERGEVGERRLGRLASGSRRRPRAGRRSRRAAPRAPSCALSRITPAASATSSAGASGWNSSAPACTESSERRWASTSCISRAIRRRSAARASSAARSACARSDRTSSRRARTNSPQPSTTPVSSRQAPALTQ